MPRIAKLARRQPRNHSSLSSFIRFSLDVGNEIQEQHRDAILIRIFLVNNLEDQQTRELSEYQYHRHGIFGVRITSVFANQSKIKEGDEKFVSSGCSPGRSSCTSSGPQA